jgi:hypothetical protein
MRKMGNKKLLKEDLNRFNQIMGYNPSKGLIKEGGEQLSMDFPVELTPEEQEVSDALDAMASFMKRNMRGGYNDSDVWVKGTGQKLFYRHSFYGDRHMEGDIEVIKAKLRGDKERDGEYLRDTASKQKIIPFNKGEVNTVEDFINLLDFIINSLEILGIDGTMIERVSSSFKYRLTREKEEKERRANKEYEKCGNCGEIDYEPGEGCESCGYINKKDMDDMDYNSY